MTETLPETRKQELLSLIHENKRRLQALKIKEAKMGLNTPPEVLIEIEDLTTRLQGLSQDLAALDEEAEVPTQMPQLKKLSSLSSSDGPVAIVQTAKTDQPTIQVGINQGHVSQRITTKK